jgi:hypothetical protein
MDYFMQQKQYHKRTTLRMLKIPLRSIRSKEGPHYCLSKAQESCHLSSNNQPIHEFGYPFGDSIPGLYCVAWLTQESVSSGIFVKKKGMNPVQSNRCSQQKPSAKGGKGKIHR